MRVFFALASAYRSDKTYRPGVERMVAELRNEAEFLSDAPSDVDVAEWISEALSRADFAFFDITGHDADVMFALGVSSQSDVMPLCLIDRQVKSSATGTVRVAAMPAKEFHGADDFQRKVRLIIEEKLGPQVVQNKMLEQRILQHIDSKTPKYMRQLARDVGKPMGDVQPVVYSLVRQGIVQKIGDKRYTQYLRP